MALKLWSRWLKGIKENAPRTDCSVVITVSPKSCLNEWFQTEIRQQKLYPFFICNVYSSVNRLHREKPTVVWSNFCFYSVQYCTVSVEKGKLTWILCYVSCFVIMECNCTIWPLYFKNTLFFTSIYLYVSMYVCTEKEKKCLFFIFVTACLNII